MDLSQSILGIFFGGEYDIADRKSKFRPFVGVELSANFSPANTLKITLIPLKHLI